ncbi:hypothetical protein [Halorubrum lacusprofundi]|uniref:Uncharacterized protein n=1 Tax=Halorubrum lacusprofundi (strain ATCC 49239 / DSM 5036 / JCM 8891 / ACAM 34) TaxID=416348 RepID=B9LUI4_HALLT|nr:hypothetical protein [Halorubrum lacusprofundi]ACM56341.1 hypothetical protein Hlac_0741 [Halorubrum lacusprofundi ATCC 49239]
MPATSQHNEQAGALPNPSPENTTEHGENPARFLVEELTVDDGDGTTGELMLARIRGLETIALCRFWLGVERYLAAHADRDPRDRVVDALEEREETLRKRGEGIAQAGLSAAERRERATELDSESVAVLVDEDGEEVSWSRQRGAVMGASR